MCVTAGAFKVSDTYANSAKKINYRDVKNDLLSVSMLEKFIPAFK